VSNSHSVEMDVVDPVDDDKGSPSPQRRSSTLCAVDNEFEHRFKLSSKLPLCATIIDHLDDPTQQCIAIRRRFVESNAEFAVNISGLRRRQLMELELDALSAAELKHVFDASYHAVYRMLQLDSFQRFLSTASSADKLCRRIARKKKRKKRRHTKSRERARRTLSSPRAKDSNVGLKPIGMLQSSSLSVLEQNEHSHQISASASLELYESENELSVKSRTPSMSPSPSPRSRTMDDHKMADPFHTLSESPSGDANDDVTPDLTMERSVHDVLHGAWKRTCDLKCC